MYFSAKQYHSYLTTAPNGAAYSYHVRQQLNLPHNAPITLDLAKKSLRHIKKLIANRQPVMTVANTPGVGPDTYIGLGKWIRPWHAVPELINFRAPAGDFGVGVEVEMGFRSLVAAQTVANYIKDWKYVTLDFEGGTFPIEATFPPMIYSKISKRSQVYRYLKFLQANPELVASNQGQVGTHVNVSCAGFDDAAHTRLQSINIQLGNIVSRNHEDAVKYFGRRPYGYGYVRGTRENRFIEYKLFNSQLDPRRLMQYINIAVELTKLSVDTVVVDETSVRAALEAGYNKHIPA